MGGSRRFPFVRVRWHISAHGKRTSCAGHHGTARRRRAAIHALLRCRAKCREGRANRCLTRGPERESEGARPCAGGGHSGTRPQAWRVPARLRLGWKGAGRLASRVTFFADPSGCESQSRSRMYSAAIRAVKTVQPTKFPCWSAPPAASPQSRPVFPRTKRFAGRSRPQRWALFIRVPDVIFLQRSCDLPATIPGFHLPICPEDLAEAE